MGAIRTTPSGYLYFDFRHRGVRCREYTTLKDSPANRKKMEQVLARVQAELTLGTFDYGAYFPRGSRAALFTRPPAPREDVAFQRFALQWYEQNKVSWKPSVAHEFLGTLKQHLLPRFDGRPVTEVTAADVKRLRLDLAQCPGRKGRPLSAKRINNICGVLRLILAEAADHFRIGNPFDAIKPLPVPKSDIDPFTFEEMDIFLRGVRPDFYNYYIVRFLTDMRTGEIDGLGWEHVDWINKKLRVRRSLYRGQFVPPKTQSSVRDIDMLPPVEEVLRAQLQITGERGSSVICNRAGRPLDHNLITKRVWYPTLKRLGLRARTPYQTRHTAATLWLASGENQEWIARQLGHSTTTMLFQVYSRFVPNLTRQDGSAFLRLLEERATIPHRQPKAMLEGQAAEPTELDPVETGKDRS